MIHQAQYKFLEKELSPKVIVEAVKLCGTREIVGKQHSKEILSVLKLEDMDKRISELSGGQKKRVALAKVLLSDADFLILDEPTNHLDLDMIEWLENYLSSSKSTILMVTHDRYFLEVVCDTILELADQTIYRYKGISPITWRKKRSDKIKLNRRLRRQKTPSAKN